jgi:hypothetical protein
MNGNGRLGREGGEAGGQALPGKSVGVNQPAQPAQPPLLAQVKPTRRQEAYIASWCQEHGIEGEWYPGSKQEASSVIGAIEEAKGSRRAQRMVEHMVRRKLAEQAA